MSLLDWFSSGSKRRPSHLHFVVYSRRDCHLCDFAWQILEDAQRRYGFGLAKTDVDSDPELQALYGMEVPVVTVNGRVRFRGAVNRVLLERLLHAEARAPGSGHEDGG